MRAVIQRVSRASVRVEGQIVGEIEQGLLIFLGIAPNDQPTDIEWLVKKIPQLRIFNDENGKFNLSLLDIKGQTLIISQFTLFADCKKGNRPSFTNSAEPDWAQTMYHNFIQMYQKSALNLKVAQGIFGADMKIELLNDGPVTILLDTHNKNNSSATNNLFTS